MRILIALLSLLLPLPSVGQEPIEVVTSFSILADMTRNIGGERIHLHNIVGPDGDAHVYEATPEDVRVLRKADLVIQNGLHFEPWLDRLVASSETGAKVVRASAGVIPRSLVLHGETIDDPHAWHSLANAQIYAANIARALIEADPAHVAIYRNNHAAYLKEIETLQVEVDRAFHDLPPDSRRIVTSHDAFGYLGQAYRIDILAPQGLSTDRAPSATEVAMLIRQIRRERIDAVFVENIRDSRLLRQIAEESGARVGGTLYSDALAAQGPASTYLGLYRHNVETILRALRR
ncbi:metal ABC transporter substrate-binding protein [Azotobacter armeniacus]